MKKWMYLLLMLLICIPVVYAEDAFVLPEELTDIVEFDSAYDDYPIVKESCLPKFLEAWNKLPEGVQHLILKRKTPIRRILRRIFLPGICQRMSRIRSRRITAI